MAVSSVSKPSRVIIKYFSLAISFTSNSRPMVNSNTTAPRVARLDTKSVCDPSQKAGAQNACEDDADNGRLIYPIRYEVFGKSHEQQDAHL